VRRRPGPLAASVAVVLCTGLFLFRRALFLDEGFVERDLAVYYRAARSLVAPLALGSGGVPQWNPYFASGQPFAANPVHGVFHPLTWLFFLLPFEWALRLQVVLPPFVAAFSMFTLLRALGRTRHAAGFGALVWGFGGYTLSTTNGLNYLFASSVLPLVLGLAARVAAGGGRRLVAALAFATGLGDFVTSIVLYTFETRPISIEILGALRQFDLGGAAAYGVVLMLISAVAMAVGTRR